jgi:starch synthase
MLPFLGTTNFFRQTVLRLPFVSFSFTVLLTSAAFANSPKILMVSPEQTHIFQTGGLAHATTGLATSLRAEGIDAEILMPAYTDMNAGTLQDTGARTSVDLGWQHGRASKRSFFSVLKNADPLNPTLFLQHITNYGQRNYFDSKPEVYGGKKNYAPEVAIGESFGAFAKASANYILSQNYDIVILNDWTTGLIALHLHEAKMRGAKTPKVIFAIHNLAYQGLFPESLAQFLGLSPEHFSIEGYEFWHQMSFLKAGLQYSDMIYTVSNQYAKEIATPRFGAGLDGLIRKKAQEGKVTGILNGIINDEWEPNRKVSGLDFTFSSKDLSGKSQGKSALQSEMGFVVNAEAPLFVLTSRLAEQKGFAYLIEAIEGTIKTSNSQWIVIGDGDANYIEQLKSLEALYPNSIRYRPFSNLLEKKLTRYGDFFVNGAWFEPSGLNQFFALKNGTLPVVSSAGGLLDSVKDGQNGLLFEIHAGHEGQSYDKNATRDSAQHGFQKAIALFQNKSAMKKMRINAMTEDHSWSSRIHTHFRSLFDYVLNRGPERLVQRQGSHFRIQPPAELLQAAGLASAPLCSKVLLH